MSSAMGSWSASGTSLPLCRVVLVLAAALLAAPGAQGQAIAGGDEEPGRAEDEQTPGSLQLGSAQLFRFAEEAEAQGDRETAKAAYQALTADPEPELRNEARFRLGMILAEEPEHRAEAARLLRSILAERPAAARVRLELSRIEMNMGERGAAARSLRIAAGAGLPQQVERMVRFFSNALSATRPSGANIELTIAGDSNINRATRANTLGTVIGDFVLNDDARARSGLGLSLQGQGYLRGGISRHGELLASASVSADIHPGQSAFNDIAVSLRAGPVLKPGKDRITFSAGPVWRWYGGMVYSRALSIGAEWQHPLGQRAQLRFGPTLALLDNRRNDLQDGLTSSVQLSVDRQIGRRGGAGVQLTASRTLARDPGYSDATAGGSAFGFREFGRFSGVVSFAYTHLEADARLFLYPRRRQDDHFVLTASLTWRRQALARIAPFVRARAERNRSTVGIYAFSRIAGEVGLNAAF